MVCWQLAVIVAMDGGEEWLVCRSSASVDHSGRTPEASNCGQFGAGVAPSPERAGLADFLWAALKTTGK